METGDYKRTTRVIKQQNILFAFESSIDPKDESFFKQLREHGDNSVRDIALQVVSCQITIDGKAKCESYVFQCCYTWG